MLRGTVRFIIFSRTVHTKTFKNLETLNLKSKAQTQNNLNNLLINMPKEQPHIPILKSARNKKKEASAKYPAGYITLQILGSGAKGAPGSLYMFTDQSRYLFNCGEGSQRLAHEHKLKLAKLEHVFLTNSSWERIGGLPGLALTIQDIGVPSIQLHGPPGLDKLFEGTRRFVILKDLQIHVTDCISKDKFHEDHVMRVDYIPIYKAADVEPSEEGVDVKSSSSDTSLGEEEDHTDYYAPIKGYKRHLEITKEEGTGPNTKKGKLEDDLLPQSGSARADCIICYVCKPKEKPGALMIQKCLDFGVPSGPLLGKLKNGEDVTLKDGRVVRAADVRSPDLRSPVFVVIDCPNESYLDGLVQNAELRKYQSNTEEDSAHVLIHFTPRRILENPKYVHWMDQFRISTTHILVSDVCDGMGSEAVHRIQHKLNLIDENMFPLLKGDLAPVTESSGEALIKNTQVQMIMGRMLLKYNLRPSTGFDESSLMILNPEEYVSETMNYEDFPAQLNELKARFASMPTSDEEYPKIVFLGTGSCIPNKTRNTSGMMLHVTEDTNMILDCGEGTYGQLVRFFGKAEVDDVLIKTKAIYVSHLHADHHLGLINLLQHREEAFIRNNVPFAPVYLIAPHQIQSWLYLYHRSFEKIKHLYDLVPTTSLIYNNCQIEPEFRKKLFDSLNMKIIETTSVRHCPNAYGVAVTGKSGWKITYSGDTMPCDFLVTLGLNSDLLIHEATMEDELKHEAELKMHSTTTEAINIGKKMNAKFILLTHFSQRYSKVPKINGELEQNVGIAFDNMRVSLRDLPKLPMMYPLLKTMFAESYEEMENKTSKKLLRIERDKQRAAQVEASV